MKNARTVRMPGLRIDIPGSIKDGRALPVTVPLPVKVQASTLQGSVRGAKPGAEELPSGTVKRRRPMTKVVRAVLRTTRENW